MYGLGMHLHGFTEQMYCKLQEQYLITALLWDMGEAVIRHKEYSFQNYNFLSLSKSRNSCGG